eukprot:1898762-Prymnesium_polylepis.1
MPGVGLSVRIVFFFFFFASDYPRERSARALPAPEKLFAAEAPGALAWFHRSHAVAEAFSENSRSCRVAFS